MTRTYKIMTHLVAGYPSLKENEIIATTMIKSGIDFLEIQIPFSDPIGDGRVITKACRDSIEKGTRTEDAFTLMQKLSKKTVIPLLLMTYYNIPLKYGLENFCKKAKSAGCHGLIIPDLPFEEAAHENFIALAKKHNLNLIQLVSPITPPERLKAISEIAEGFVYCVAGFGTTGTKQNFDKELEKYLTKVKKYIKIPLALGFGISKKSEIKKAGKLAEIVVIGSKIIKMYDNKKDLKEVSQFLEA